MGAETIRLIIAIVLSGTISGVTLFFMGIRYRKSVAEAKIGSADEEAKRILNDAIKTAEAKKKEALLEAKEESIKSRNEAEKEIKERRSEIQRQERRILQKDESLDKKLETIERKEEQLAEKIKDAENMKTAIAETHKAQSELLQRISKMTIEQAKEYLLETITADVRHDAAVKIKEIEQKAKDEADIRARELITYAIQKCAADHVAEATVSVVNLPNDEIKGRIIGREGRNIRTLETLTGVDVIIDDTPEAITLSGFDLVRREVARLTLEKLISDGRIHPGRIEETVDKSKKEVDLIIKQEGDRAILETGVRGMNPELVKLLGRMKFRTSFGQNVLNHSIEVAHLSGIMAAELGLDATIAKRAGLLHDIGKAVDHEHEGSHVELGAEIAKKYKEHADVLDSILSHHGDKEPASMTACLVQAADAISAARPGARRENLENYIKRLQKLEEIANSFEGVEKSFAIQAGREIRIIVRPEIVNDESTYLVAREIVKKIESELEYPGNIKINVIRETRAIEYAK